MLDFILRHELGENVLVSRKTAKVDEQIELGSIDGWFESNILQRHEKCQFYAFADVARGADRAEYFMAPNRPGKPFPFKPNLFFSNLGEVFPLPEFQAKLFLMRNWVGGFYRESLLIVKIKYKFSLLAEVSHGEANKRMERDLCRLPTRFLSRMRWRFLNNHWRFSHLRHDPQNRFARETSVETRVCFGEFFAI